MSAAKDSLADIQARMQAHVLLDDKAALRDMACGEGLAAARRLGIYHHAYRARLIETLRDSFGHTHLYLGDAWFDHLARAFVEQHPSTHSNLRWYGQAWPDWLAAQLVADSGPGAHPEVAELARLDWALRQAFDAADAPVLTLSDLGALVATDGWVGAALRPQPSVGMFTVAHNTLSMWHALDQDEAVPPPEALPSPIGVLVWRRDTRPHFRSVSAMESVALAGLLRGQSFADICGDLGIAFEQQDTMAVAAALLRRWVDDGVLTPLHPGR